MKRIDFANIHQNPEIETFVINQRFDDVYFQHPKSLHSSFKKLSNISDQKFSVHYAKSTVMQTGMSFTFTVHGDTMRGFLDPLVHSASPTFRGC